MPTFVEHAAMRFIDQEYRDAVARTAEMVLEDRVPEIEDPHIIFHRDWKYDTDRSKLTNAVRNGNLTVHQWADVQMASLILSGRTEPGARRDILVEARVSTSTKDIQKARRRAKALRTATNIPTLPVVFTVRTTNEEIQKAQGKYSLTKNYHWDTEAPTPEYQQDNAQVEVITFDPGEEFHQLWQAILA